MLQLLKSNQPQAFIMVILMIPIMLGLLALTPSGIETDIVSWNNRTGLKFLMNEGILTTIYFLTCLILGSFLLNNLYSKNEFISVDNMFGGFMYAFLILLGSKGISNHPILFANLFLLLGINKWLKVFRQANVGSLYFDSSFLVGIALIFYPEYLILVPFFLVAILYTRTFKSMELFVFALGMILPGFLFFSFGGLLIGPDFIWNASLPQFAIGAPSISGIPDILLIVVCLALFIMGLRGLIGDVSSSNNKSRNTKTVVLILSLGFLVTIYLGQVETINSAILHLSIPLALLIPCGFTGRRIPTWKKIAFYLFLISSVLYFTGTLERFIV